MVDLTDSLIPLRQVPLFLPSARPGKKLNLATVWRWATHGLRGVRLETVKVGGTRYTSRAALSRFAAALSGEPTVPPSVTPARRRREHEQAAAACDKAGIK